LSAEALVDALHDGGILAGQIGDESTANAVWQRAAMLLGLPQEEAKRRAGDSIPPGSGNRKPIASDVLFALVRWALAVEYVHDLKRTPYEPWLVPLTTLPAPVIETCRSLARHLRERHRERYGGWAKEVEDELEREAEAASAEDLGHVDTFLFEDRKVFSAALIAFHEQRFEAAQQWALARREEHSFWTRNDRQRWLAWQLVEQAASLGCLVQTQANLLAGAHSHAEAVERYTTRGYPVDTAHRKLEQARQQAPALESKELTRLHERLDELRHLYRGWSDTQALAFNKLTAGR
jgi:hypothetical protein